VMRHRIEPHGVGNRRRIVLAVVVIALTAVVVRTTVALEGSGRATVHQASSAQHPNILVVTTDDQTASEFTRQTMPFTMGFFRDRGSVFTNSMAVPPLCCPDRAGFITGEYAQNHGVETNEPGYPHLREKENTLPVWLGRAGYRTGLVGKFLNGFPVLGGTTPPGWDEFFAAGGEEIAYRDFDVAVNGRPRHYSHRYSTDVYTSAAERFISGAHRDQRPFFLWLTYNAPHTVADGVAPCPGQKGQPESMADFRQAADVPMPSNPATRERDTNDKGPWVSGLPPVDKARSKYIHKKWRCSVSALPPVDRGMRSIVGELRRAGELNRTIIVFDSDNGFFYGEHGIPADKEIPYDPALRVPLAIYVPPSLRDGPVQSDISSLVSNVDLAPTLLHYAHARPCRDSSRCRTIDGRSLKPLLGGRSPDWASDRALPIELDSDFVYQAFRSPRLFYMKLEADRTGQLGHPEHELYNLRRDPFELHNLFARGRGVSEARKQRLADRLTRVTHCAGTHGPRECP
jgi:N-acetylglucosamine-6-sulfatase